jgi:hypothetical protein
MGPDPASVASAVGLVLQSMSVGVAELVAVEAKNASALKGRGAKAIVRKTLRSHNVNIRLFPDKRRRRSPSIYTGNEIISAVVPNAIVTPIAIS